MSHEQKPSYFPLYRIVNRDPYSGVPYNPNITGLYNPLYNPTKQDILGADIWPHIPSVEIH